MEKARIDEKTGEVRGFPGEMITGGRLRPVSLDEDMAKMEYAPLLALDEAVLRTYPAEMLVKHLCSLLNLSPISEYTPGEYNPGEYNGFILITGDKNHIIIHITNQEMEETIKWKAISRAQDFGWTYVSERVSSFSGTPGGRCLTVSLEKKFTEDLTDEVRKLGKLYHFCKTRHLKKILRIGLNPKLSQWKGFGGHTKGENETLLKPENVKADTSRIYFFTKKNAIQPEFYFKEKNPEGDTFVQLEIDVAAVPGARFYYDPRQYQAVYTFDNIPPSAITVLE